MRLVTVRPVRRRAAGRSRPRRRGVSSRSRQRRHLAAYAGIAPVTRSSGSSIKGEHFARTDNRKLKRAGSMKLKTVLGLRPRSRRVPPPVARRRHFPRVGGRAVATHADLHRRTSVRTQGAEPGTTATHHPICRLPPVEPRGGRMIAGPQSLTFEASSIRATDPHRSLTRADQGRWAQSSSWRKAHLVRCESRTAAMWSQKSPSRSQRANSTLASVSRRAAAW